MSLPGTPARMVDPCFALVLGDPRNTLRPPAVTTTLSRFRQAADAAMIAETGPAAVSAEPRNCTGPGVEVPLRLYRASADAGLPLVLFIHGGGFVLGSLETHDALCRDLAQRTGAAVLAIDYRRAPEAPFPAALDDCMAALTWAMANADDLGVDRARVAICGDSAGGHLAVMAALRARDAGVALAHVGLLYPMVDPACDSPSAQALADGYFLTRTMLAWFWTAYRPANATPDASVLDLLRADLRGLPPMSIATAEFDPLRDEGEALATRARAEGVTVIARRYLGMIHGFASLPSMTMMAGHALSDLAQDLRASFERDRRPC